MIQSALTVLALFGGTFAAIGPITDLRIQNKLIKPDGFERVGVLAEGVFPGPTIKGYKNDRFVVNVVNELTNATMRRSTSIHWHGIFQKNYTYADGPAFVSQCPIAPGHSFLYDFQTLDQAGTFWYHSHLSTQYCDGLRGPLIIYDPNDPHRHLYDVDDESTIITLADWYHVPSTLAGPLPTPNATLINGRGRQPSTPDAPLSIINVEHGKRYRFRLISMSCDPSFNFTIDGHQFTVIETDGTSTVGVKTDKLQIFAAQRYSFVLHADQPVGNYWIRANPDRGNNGSENGINSAVLRYRSAPEAEPTTVQQPSLYPLLEQSLAPLENPGAPGAPYLQGADVYLDFIIGFNGSTLNVNNVSYASPKVPVLLQILSGATSASDLLPSGSIYPLPPNKVIQIQIPGGTPGAPHPIHVHGHTFDVIRSAGSQEYNFVNPPRRDVVNSGLSGDDVFIRFVTDNRGPWMMHCHIDWHLQLGLAIVLVEDSPEIAAANPVPESWKDLCPIYNALPPSEQ